MGASSYWEVDENDLREYFADTNRTYLQVCATHRRLFDRYKAIPETVRDSPNISGQISEDLSELRQASTYPDTLFGQIMAVLGEVLESGDATFEQLTDVEDFVGRLKAQNKKLERAVKKLESHAAKLKES